MNLRCENLKSTEFCITSFLVDVNSYERECKFYLIKPTRFKIWKLTTCLLEINFNHNRKMCELSVHYNESSFCNDMPSPLQQFREETRKFVTATCKISLQILYL